MNKKLSCKFLLLCAIVVLLLSVAICPRVFATNNAANDTEIDKNSIENYLNSEGYYDPETGLTDDTRTVFQYPEYFSKRYLGRVVGFTERLEDEQILGFVPKELFLKPGQYFYYGQIYGFFIDSQKEDILVFLFKMEIENNSLNGYISTKIAPLFCYDFNIDIETGKVYPCYTKEDDNDDIIHYYEKKIHIANIGFSTSIYNTRHLNLGQDGYSGADDDGMFIIGSRYIYSGVSMKDSLKDAVIRFALGALSKLDKSFGYALNALEFIDKINNLKNNIKSDYREVLSNVALYQFSDDGITSKIQQLEEFEGKLVKDGAAVMETPLYNPILFKADSSGDNFAKGTFIVSRSANWGTRMATKINFDIVREEDGVCELLYENVVSEDFVTNIMDEEPIEISETNSFTSYLMPCDINEFIYVADKSGYFSFETSGESEHKFILYKTKQENGKYVKDTKIAESSDKPNDGGQKINQIKLDKDEKYFVLVENTTNEAVILPLTCFIDPIEVGLDKPAENYYFKAEENYHFAFTAPETDIYAFELTEGMSLSIFDSTFSTLYEIYEKENKLYAELSGGQTYYLQLYNPMSTSVYADIAVSVGDAIQVDYNSQLQIENFELIKFIPEKTMQYNVSVVSDYLNITINNITDEIICYNQSGSNHNTNQIFEEGKKYIIKIRKTTASDYVNAVIKIAANPVMLTFGSTTIYNTADEYQRFVFSPTLTMKYDFSCEKGNTIYIYDENGIFVDNDITALIANEKYFVDIYFEGTENLIIDINATAVTHGVATEVTLDETGHEYMVFEAPVTGDYSFQTLSNYQLLNEFLEEKNNYFLQENEIVYVVLSGSNSESTALTILYSPQQVVKYVNMSLSSGDYLLQVETQGNYTVNLRGSTNLSFGLTILKLNETTGALDIFQNEITTNGEYEYSLSAGAYYLRINVNINRTITVNVGDGKTPTSAIEILEGIDIEKSYSNGEETIYKFTSSKTAEYEMLISAVSGYSSDILIYTTENNFTNFIDYSIIEGDVDNRAVYTFQLNANKTYYIKVKNDGDARSITFKLIVPTIIQKIELIREGNESNKFIIYQNNVAYRHEIALGVNYYVRYEINNDATNKNISLSANSSSNIAFIYTGNKFYFKPTGNVENLFGTTISLIFNTENAYIAGAEKEISINLTIVPPVNATSTINNYVYLIELRNELNNTVVPEDFEVQLDDIVWADNNSLSMDMLYIEKFDLEEITGKIKIVWKIPGTNIQFEYFILMDGVLFTELNATPSYGTINDVRANLNIQGFINGNHQITIGSEVKLLIIRGDISEKIKLNIDFASDLNDITIWLQNVQITAYVGENIFNFDDSCGAEVNMKIFGKCILHGYSGVEGTSVIYGKNITLNINDNGSSELNIYGGEASSSSGSGGHGIYCNKLKIHLYNYDIMKT